LRCVSNRRHRFEFTLRLYSAPELRRMLKSAGFRRTEVYGSLKGEPYDADCRRLIVVGRKD
jgi:hypothetical protein